MTTETKKNLLHFINNSFSDEQDTLREMEIGITSKESLEKLFSLWHEYDSAWSVHSNIKLLIRVLGYKLIFDPFDEKYTDIIEIKEASK